MASETQIQKEDLISRWQYIHARLGVLWRYPTIIKTIKHIERIADEGRESWGSMLEETAAKFPANAAVKSEDGNYTWKEYNDWTNRYANYFISQGMKKGDTAVVFLENRPELLMAYSAMAKIGAANSMINTNLRQESLLHCLKLNAACTFIVGEEVLDAFEEVKAELYSGGDLNPGGNRKIYFLQDKGKRAAPEGYIDLKDAVANIPPTNPPTTGEVKPADPLSYVFTSGTTGGMPRPPSLPTEGWYGAPIITVNSS